MKSWEFLIQKEGDRQWHPITPPTVQLEAGKYRMVAQSHRANNDIEVRLIPHSPTAEERETPSKYHRRINAQGMVMILPFTELSPGTSWEIRCCGDIMSELLGDTWQEKVILDILPILAVTDAASDNLENQELPFLLTDDTHTKAQSYLQQLEQLLKGKIEPQLHNFEVTISEPENTEVQNVHDLENSEETPTPILKLVLDQEEIHRNLGEKIVLSGRIEARDIQADLVLTAKLRYILKHPQTEEILVNQEYPLCDESLPYHFDYSFSMPEEGEIEFLVGEVALEAITGVAIATCPITVTTTQYNPVNYTIELSSTEADISYTFDLELAEKINSSAPPLELPKNFRYTKVLPLSFPVSHQILPPKLNRNSASLKPNKKALKLPQISLDKAI